MSPAVINVEALPDYLLKLRFDNGEERKFDLKPYLNFGVFQELKDVSKFERVRISFDTIEWENEADLDPEFLYCASTLIESPI